MVGAAPAVVFAVIESLDLSDSLLTRTLLFLRAIYWFLIRPGSALIRRAILRAIRREAERLTVDAHR